MMRGREKFAGGAPSARQNGPGGVSRDRESGRDSDASAASENRPGGFWREIRCGLGESGLSTPKNTSNCAGRLLTPKETAGFLGIPEGTLAQWRSQRRGPPYIKLEGRLVRYRALALQEYLSRHTVTMEVDNAHA
jgi:predicted DNA-binding transcriptional regulator AlpA